MEKMDFIHTSPLSHEKDKNCIFAMTGRDTVHCKAVLTWWHDLDVRLHEKCFNKGYTRDKLLWRNRQIKKLP